MWTGPSEPQTLAATAATTEPLLSGIDPAVLAELRSAFAHARAGRVDELRSDLLIASGRLAVLLHADRPRRAGRRPRTHPALVAGLMFGP